MYGLIPLTVFIAIATVIVLIATLRAARRATVDGRLLLRLYLETAALTGMLFFAIELTGPVRWALGETFGSEAIYGSVPAFETPPPSRRCAPPNAPMCQPPDVQRELWLADRERRHGDDLTRGAVFGAIALLVTGVHFALRRYVLAPDERRSLLHRSHLVVGLIAFGIAVAIYLPPGVASLLDRLDHPRYENSSGASPYLSLGISTLVVWLAYAVMLRGELRPAPIARPHEVEWLSGKTA